MENLNFCQIKWLKKNVDLNPLYLLHPMVSESCSQHFNTHPRMVSCSPRHA